MSFEDENVQRCRELKPVRKEPVPLAKPPAKERKILFLNNTADGAQRFELTPEQQAALCAANIARLKYQAAHGFEKPAPHATPPGVISAPAPAISKPTRLTVPLPFSRIA